MSNESETIKKIAKLAYDCIQWGDGELTGYDITMLENDLQPILQEYSSIQVKEKESRISQLEELLNTALPIITEYLNSGTINDRERRRRLAAFEMDIKLKV